MPFDSEVACLQAQMALLNRLIALEITSACPHAHWGHDVNGWWLDTRPGLDPRERSAESVDLLAECLRVGQLCGLVRRHLHLPHLVAMAGAARNAGDDEAIPSRHVTDATEPGEPGHTA